MAFKPDELKASLERERQDRMRRESFQRQAVTNLLNSKGNIKKGDESLSNRDRAIKEGMKAANVSKYSVPEGTTANGMLELTFGKDRRQVSQTLTDENLITFAKNIEQAASRFAGGITPQQVINWSLPIDRERATKQIHLAVPMTRKAGLVKFMTNAGPDSKDTHHYVQVELLGFGKALSGAREKGIMSVKKYIVEQGIRFTCDCGRHRYYYNYIAGLGNYHLGAKETRYPFIRNEKLSGLACKHVLRVMQWLTSPTGGQWLVGQVNDERKKQDYGKAKANTTKREDLTKIIEQQAKRANHTRNQVLTTEERPGYRQRMLNQAKKAAQAEAATKTKAKMKAEIMALLRTGQQLSKAQQDWVEQNLS